MQHNILLLRLLLVSSIMMQHVHCHWIDPDTNQDFYTTIPLTNGDNREYQLVRLYKMV